MNGARNYQKDWQYWIPGGLFLLLQLGINFYELTLPTRTFSWAPHTAQVHFNLLVFRQGEALTEPEVRARYGISTDGWEHHAPANLHRIIETTERQRGNHPDSVRLTYSVNGHDPVVKKWYFAPPTR